MTIIPPQHAPGLVHRNDGPPEPSPAPGAPPLYSVHPTHPPPPYAIPPTTAAPVPPGHAAVTSPHQQPPHQPQPHGTSAVPGPGPYPAPAYYNPYPYYPPPPPPYGYPIYYHPHQHPPPPPYHYGVPAVSGDMSLKDDKKEQVNPDQTTANISANAESNANSNVNTSIPNIHQVPSNLADSEDGSITAGQPSHGPAHGPGHGSHGDHGDQHAYPREVLKPLKTKPEILQKRSAKGADLKQIIQRIGSKTEEEKTPEERRLYDNYEIRRRRKNERSRERTKENKREMTRLLNIPEGERSEKEQDWLRRHLKAKKRKNMKDRERRKRMKMNGSNISGPHGLNFSALSMSITASSSSLMSNTSMTSSQGNEQDLLHCDTYTSVESGMSYIDSSYSDVTEPIKCSEGGSIQISGGDGPISTSGSELEYGSGHARQQHNEEQLSPSFLLHLASVMESPSPDSPNQSAFVKSENLDECETLSHNKTKNSTIDTAQGPICTIRTNFFDSTSNSTSPIRLPVRREPGTSRSSIFRLKKT